MTKINYFVEKNQDCHTVVNVYLHVHRHDVIIGMYQIPRNAYSTR
nr:MAG TPA: hypothetical protein [Caudoviricetes sp.]